MDATKQRRLDLINKIKGLQAKTIENGCTEQEAAIAAEMAARLIDKYQFDQSEFDAQLEPLTENTYYGPGKSLKGLFYVSQAVGKFCDVILFSRKEGSVNRIVYFGRESDCAFVEYLLNLLGSAFSWEWKKYVAAWEKENKRRLSNYPSILNSHRKAFDIGIAERLIERLTQMKEERDRQTHDGRSGKDLVITKMAVVETEAAKRYIFQKSNYIFYKIDKNAYMAGWAAGEGVQINQGIAENKGKVFAIS
jgi:hypothetical protein